VGNKLTIKSLGRMVYKWLKVYGWELEKLKDRSTVLEFRLITLEEELEDMKKSG